MRSGSKIFRTFRSHYSVFALEKQPKNLTSQIFLSLINPLGATVNEKRAPTSRKYVAGQGIMMAN